MGSGAAAATLTHRPMSSEPEKSFKCPTCSRVFNKKANLKVHSRKHTGEKPYACSRPGCGRAFMWKSSVTFHEQNCPSKKEKDAPPSPMSVASKGVQKRPKSSRSAVEMRTPPKQNTPNSAAKRRPSRARSPPTTPMTPEDVVRDPGHIRDEVMLSSHVRAAKLHDNRAVADMMSHAGGGMFSAHSQPNSAGQPAGTHAAGAQAMAIAPPLTSNPSAGSSPFGSVSQATAIANPFASSPQPVTAIAHPSFVGTPDGHTLPAPSTLLREKPLSGGGRPPVIPGSLPRNFLGLQGGKETSGSKLFDLRVPSSPMPSSAKPPAMYNNKMPKMPIAMELDDSDDEGPVKIVGAQDAFMRTGNPFGGFAPPTRCSPLPVCSPIVCPGISPMPLSPLAPFSPLPPDSPAHNAPNPVHPPLHQPSRPANTNW